MFKRAKKKTPKLHRGLLTAYSIIMILVIILGVITNFLPAAQFNDAGELINGSGVVSASLSQILLSPFGGFKESIDIILFILSLGGLLGIMVKTQALETGIKVLVRAMKGREILLIPLLMFVFSILGTSYGFLEESVGFYVLLAATMFAAGMDPLVGVATILLGAGVGAMGSTINPFATGLVLNSLPEDVHANSGLTMLIGVVIWIVGYVIATAFVMLYARRVIKNKGSTFLSLREQHVTARKYGKYLSFEGQQKIKLTGKQKVTLILFALSFIVMIIGLIPWQEFNINFFNGFTGWLTGQPFGQWGFLNASLWFVLMAIIISIVNRFKEKEFIEQFIHGAADMIGVVIIIAIARGVSVLMTQTHLDNFIIYNISGWLATLPEIIFVPLNYLIHVGLSFFMPSSSGLAVVSAPITVTTAAQLGYSVEVASMTIVSANGLVNLFTPTCGAIMAGLALAKIEYSTWLRWVLKIVLALFVANIAILCLFALFG